MKIDQLTEGFGIKDFMEERPFMGASESVEQQPVEERLVRAASCRVEERLLWKSGFFGPRQSRVEEQPLWKSGSLEPRFCESEIRGL